MTNIHDIKLCLCAAEVAGSIPASPNQRSLFCRKNGIRERGQELFPAFSTTVLHQRDQLEALPSHDGGY
jgi:hypothetical protein